MKYKTCRGHVPNSSSALLPLWGRLCSHLAKRGRTGAKTQRERRWRSDRSGSWSLRRWGRACIHHICPTSIYFHFQKVTFYILILLELFPKIDLFLDVYPVLYFDVNPQTFFPFLRTSMIFWHHRSICLFWTLFPFFEWILTILWIFKRNCQFRRLSSF